jgi:hypothetical protein
MINQKLQFLIYNCEEPILNLASLSDEIKEKIDIIWQQDYDTIVEGTITGGSDVITNLTNVPLGGTFSSIRPGWHVVIEDNDSSLTIPKITTSLTTPTTSSNQVQISSNVQGSGTAVVRLKFISPGLMRYWGPTWGGNGVAVRPNTICWVQSNVSSFATLGDQIPLIDDSFVFTVKGTAEQL